MVRHIGSQNEIRTAWNTSELALTCSRSTSTNVSCFWFSYVHLCLWEQHTAQSSTSLSKWLLCTSDVSATQTNKFDRYISRFHNLQAFGQRLLVICHSGLQSQLSWSSCRSIFWSGNVYTVFRYLFQLKNTSEIDWTINVPILLSSVPKPETFKKDVHRSRF